MSFPFQNCFNPKKPRAFLAVANCSHRYLPPAPSSPWAPASSTSSRQLLLQGLPMCYYFKLTDGNEDEKKEMVRRAIALYRRVEELQNRERELQKREKELQNRERELQKREEELQNREEEIAKMELRLRNDEVDLRRQQAYLRCSRILLGVYWGLLSIFISWKLIGSK